MLVKITAELLSILALVTEEFKQGRLRESAPVDALLYSEKRSEIFKETFWREEHRGGTTEVRPTNARRSSDMRWGDSQSRLRSRPEYECGDRR
jgi:hypothetical protein